MTVPRGHPRAPASAAELEHKFRLGAARRLSPEQTDAALAALACLPHTDLQPLLDALRA